MIDNLKTIVIGIVGFYVLGSLISMISTKESQFVISLAIVIWVFLMPLKEALYHLLTKKRGL